MTTDFCTNSTCEESEEEGLLTSEANDYGTTERKQKPASKSFKKYIPVEVVAFFYFTQVQLMLSYFQFFLHAKATADYDRIHSFNGTGFNDTAEREATIQSQTTWTVLVIVQISLILSLIPTFICGTWTSWCGRRKPLLWSSLGSTVFCLTVLLVVVCDVNVFYICFGAVANGISGYFGTMNASLFSMVSDLTPPGTQRAWRTVLVNGACYMGSLLGVAITGVWVEASGYLDILYFSMAVNLTTLIVIIMFVPETKPKLSGELPSLRKTWKAMKERFSFLSREDENHSRRLVRLSYITILLVVSVESSKLTLLPLYFQGPPLLWKPGKISLFMAIRSTVAMLIITSTSRFLQKYLSELHLGVIGALSNMAMYSLIGFANDDIMVYVAVCCSVYVELVLPMMRSHMSHIVLPTEQGSMQSLVSICEIISASLLSVVIIGIYNATLPLFPGFILILMALVMAVVFGLILYISKLMRTKKTARNDTTIEYPSLK